MCSVWTMTVLLIYFIDYCKGYSANVGQWGYDGAFGPDEWPNVQMEGNDCGRYYQSPININTNDVSDTSVELTLINHNLTFPQTSLLNNGHNANLVLNVSNVDELPILLIKYANGNIGRYDFNSLHFHFGSSDDHGSEHQIDGQKFPMEMHCIFFKHEYGNYNNSIKHFDGLVVIAAFYEISDEVEGGLVQITDMLSAVRSPMDETSIPILDLKLLLPEVVERYYEYYGSLTIPPCSQAVWWYILKDRFPVTECQMDKFRNLLTDPPNEMNDLKAHYIANNIRPLQPLHDRIVYSRN